MKNRFLLTCISIVLCAICTYAYDFKIDGICYTILDDASVAVSEELGKEEVNDCLIIPPKVQDGAKLYEVKAIADSAFLWNQKLKVVDIPNTVTKIGIRAFAKCTNLKAVILPISVSMYIGERAFENCENLTYVNISNMTMLGDYSFVGSGLKSADINARGIAYHAFDGCVRLASIVLGSNVSEIKSQAFCGCHNLDTIISTPVVPPIVYLDSFAKYINTSVYVWQKSLNAYRSNTVWHRFGNGNIKVNYNEDRHVFVSDLVVEHSEIKMSIGEMRKLKVYVVPINATEKTITLTSSDNSVVVAYNDGSVKAVGTGRAVVTVASTENGKATVECYVQVGNAVKSVTIKEHELNIGVGEKRKLNMVIAPDNADNKMVKWSTSDKNVVCVSDEGEIKAIVPGSAVVYATSVECDTIRDSCFVHVVNPVKKVTLGEHELSLKAKETRKLTASVEPANADDGRVVWKSSDTKVVSVNNDGEITAVKAGKAFVFATAAANETIKDSCLVTVTQSVTGITLDKKSIHSSTIGEVVQLTATVLPDDADDKRVNWASSKPEVCTVSPSGAIVVLADGTSVVTATTLDGGFVAVCTVEVSSAGGVEGVAADDVDYTDAKWYDIDGREATYLKKGGVYVVKPKTGKAKKVVIR